jgi:hypothetical protein
MADEKPEDSTPETEEALRKAKVGVKDRGEIVSGPCDEPMSGLIADIADGDD